MPIHRPSTVLALCLACVLSTAGFAQTLARPGWAGSGLTAAAWWQHAVLYEIDPANFNKAKASDLQGITQHLDYLQSLGVDALLLTPIQPPAAAAPSVDPVYGTLDDLDDLIHQASSHNIRVLLSLNSSDAATGLTAAARFWLNHGVAGFHLIEAPNSSADIYSAQIGALRKVINSYVGQRIVIGDFSQTDSAAVQPKASPRYDYAGAQLLLDPRAGTATQLGAATIRPAIDAAQDLIQVGRVMPVLLSDGPDYTRSMSRYGDGKHDLDIAKTLATMLFATRASSLIYYGQEVGVAATPASAGSQTTDSVSSGAALIHWDAPPAPAKGKPAPAPNPDDAATPNVALEDANPSSLLNWYRQLSALHHSNATISSGANITLDHDDQNVLVWVRKPQAVSTISPAIVVICNLSAQPVQLSLKEDMQRLHLRGSFLRTVLRSDTGSGPMDLDLMTISPFGVYIGELRF